MLQPRLRERGLLLGRGLLQGLRPERRLRVWDGYCAGPKCLACDPDCCSDTDECASFGAVPPFYCKNRTLDGAPLPIGTCRRCDTSGTSDQYVPDPICVGIEHDFCNSTVSCTDSNTYCECDNGDLSTGTCSFGTCLAKRGNLCDSDAECNANTYCSRESHLCTSNCFISVTPATMSAKVGEVRLLKAVINNPVGQQRTYRLRIVETGNDGTDAPFASFLDDSHSADVVVPKNGRKEVLIQFKAAAVGKYAVVLAISDKEFAGSAHKGTNANHCGTWANKADITVETEVTALRFLSAPGPGILEMGLLAALAGFAFVLAGKAR